MNLLLPVLVLIGSIYLLVKIAKNCGGIKIVLRGIFLSQVIVETRELGKI